MDPEVTAQARYLLGKRIADEASAGWDSTGFTPEDLDLLFAQATQAELLEAAAHLLRRAEP